MEQHQIKELSSPSSIELTRKCKKIEDLCKIVYEMGIFRDGDWNFDSEVADSVGLECVCFMDEFLHAFSSCSFHSRE